MRFVFMLSAVCFTFVLQAREGMRVAFYNVENYFDCTDDSLKQDEEFLPNGIRGWTPARFRQKTGNIARVIASIGEDRFPELVGLAEVENEACLRKLALWSPLRNAGYAWVHYESADVRGVDVALLYNRYWFRLLGSKPVPVTLGDGTKKTRDLLHAAGLLPDGSLLHVFVCHWPSRIGGKMESQPLRKAVAKVLRSQVDSLLALDSGANILIMGDFNDHPDDKALVDDLNARKPGLNARKPDLNVQKPGGDTVKADSPLTGASRISENATLFNLMAELKNTKPPGTHKNSGEWGILDQILVSGALLERCSTAHIHAPDFLLVPDERWLGLKPLRTWNGMTWQGGYSDHLPVWVDLSVPMLP